MRTFALTKRFQTFTFDLFGPYVCLGLSVVAAIAWYRTGDVLMVFAGAYFFGV